MSLVKGQNRVESTEDLQNIKLGKRNFSESISGVSGQADLNVVYCETQKTKRSNLTQSQTTTDPSPKNKRDSKAEAKES